MGVDGNRLRAHNARIKDLHRKKSDSLKSSKVNRSKQNNTIDFDPIDQETLTSIKAKIRKQAIKKRRIDLLILILSISIAVLLFIFFTNTFK